MARRRGVWYYALGYGALAIIAYFEHWSGRDYVYGFGAATAFLFAEGLAWMLNDILNVLREIEQHLRQLRLKQGT